MSRRDLLQAGIGAAVALGAAGSDAHAATAASLSPPAPYGPVPSARQLRWQEMAYYGFLHFTVNTFTDREWGNGDEDPAVFNPTDFDADQIVGAARDGGMAGLILTCKHHDGFCLWPSKYTEHSVKNSPWRGGKGDVVREISEACRHHGLKFGVYLSPWDRNHAEYGRPAYVTYYQNQIRELMTGYGPIFEVWFDGANGGDGYYGGARERRSIDANTYYAWPKTWQIIRELQPEATLHGDYGPDSRWVGNEQGIAGDPCWATLADHDLNFGAADTKRLNQGERPGAIWSPAECDVSIRPGWFYHASEDGKVKSPETLLDLYYASVGRGATLLLNVPPDRRGRIHESDAAALRGFRRLHDAIFVKNRAAGAKVSASGVRGGDVRAFGAANVLDRKLDTYWSTDDGEATPELVLTMRRPETFDVVSLREFLPLGQRIDAFALDAWQNGQWAEFARGNSVGSRRLIRVTPVTTERVRLRITQAAACPAISELGLFAEPAGLKRG